MFEYILKNKRATYAYDNQTGINTFENTKNINDIIITLNNIESIENTYNIILDEYHEKKLSIKEVGFKTIVKGLCFIVLGILMNNLFVLICGSLMFILDEHSLISNKLKERKLNKEYLEKLNILSKANEKEKQNLNYFKQTDKKINIEKEEQKIELSTSETIESLYKTLEIIEFYIENEKKLKKLDKLNLLEETLAKILKTEEIEYIKFLIIDSEVKNEKEKVKQLKK